MREILDSAAAWVAEERQFGLAVLVSAQASSPRELGAAMIVDADGVVFGNVSAGCVDGDVHDLCVQAIETGESTRVRYGISDETAFEAGLSCGGVIDVLVLPVLPGTPAAAAITDLHAAILRREPCALGIFTAGPGTGELLLARESVDAAAVTDPGIRRALVADLARLRTDDHALTLRYGTDVDPLEVLGVPFPHAPRLIIIGAVEFSVALSRLGAASGFEVTVCDPRDAFAAPARFPDAHEVVHEWPRDYLARTPIDARTAICVLTHDPRFDVPALSVALCSPAGYVGAMGSRRTHDDRARRLREAGVTDAEAERLRSPIGLALGGRTPEETALSILAEIVMVRSGGRGEALRDATGPVHPALSTPDVPRSQPGAEEGIACAPGAGTVVPR
ncbi:XdhC family protein [Microbacterium sp.]|uniref:XdhC family protein n=1 Tax=Microbacterium sp. TaxID=51671 RepID=UPI002636195C|nr:XdhC/CoxI family protein [Microbacterium sp.]